MADQETGATPDPTAGATPAPSSDATSDAAPLGEGGLRALEAERKARRESEQRATQAEARVAELEAASLRREVATTKGVPEALLRGESREELEALADQLLEFQGANRSSSPYGRPRENLVPGTAPDDAEPAQDMGKLAEQILHPGL